MQRMMILAVLCLAVTAAASWAGRPSTASTATVEARLDDAAFPRQMNRDKTGTTGGTRKGNGPQTAVVKRLASHGYSRAEGTGLEPATGRAGI